MRPFRAASRITCQPPRNGRAAIALAVPQGSRRRKSWYQDLTACWELARVRADRRANILACAKQWWLCADWHDHTTWRTNAAIAKATELSVSTVKMARRWLEAHGWLGVVSQGRSARCAARATGGVVTRNEAAVYVLAVPRTEHRRRERDKRALEAEVQVSQQSQPPTMKLRVVKDPPRARHHPKTGIKHPSSPVTGVTAGWYRHLARPFLAAGWSERDILHAVDYWPGGKPHDHLTNTVRQPAGWLRWRLAQWLRPDGGPGLSRSQRAERAAERARAEQAARLAEDAAQSARRVDATPHAASIRERLGWQRGPVRVTSPAPRLLIAMTRQETRTPR